MHRLIYLSSALPAFSENDLHDILTKSRRNNKLLDVTGLLLYHDRSILQILEGDKQVVNTLFLTISKDPRHTRIIKLIDEEIDSRDFSDWLMGFKALSESEWNQLSGFVQLINKQDFFSGMDPKSIQIMTMVKTFITVNVR